MFLVKLKYSCLVSSPWWEPNSPILETNLVSILGEDFNRAALMNIGFVEAIKMYDFDCFVFHDVDLVPEDDR